MAGAFYKRSNSSLGPIILHQFLRFFQFLSSLLSNPGNHLGWPAVVSDDVLRHVFKLKSDVFVVAGHVKGKTLLPQPKGAEAIDVAQSDERR